MHGGKRTGAGRPKGRNIYGESTKPLRIPISKINAVKAFLSCKSIAEPTIALPLYLSKVKAGFPSPADDYIESKLNLHQHLVKNPAATFFVIASGDSMLNAGIQDNDMLIVDRSLPISHGKIVIAALEGELTVKRLSCLNGSVKLLPENPDYNAIDITNEQDLIIWGIVTHVIHAVK